jgi:hypothetical protein
MDLMEKDISLVHPDIIICSAFAVNPIGIAIRERPEPEIIEVFNKFPLKQWAKHKGALGCLLGDLRKLVKSQNATDLEILAENKIKTLVKDIEKFNKIKKEKRIEINC